MTKVSFSASVFVIALTSMWHTAQLSFAQDFYAGKTIRIIVGFPAGGGFDTYSRIIGRHFGKFIPGNPAVVVDNVTGAGSLVAANMIYKVAKPDGLTIGNFIGNLVSQQLFGGPGVEFDARKFEWIGVPTRDHVVCALTKASGITSIDAWMRRKPRSSSAAALRVRPTTIVRNYSKPPSACRYNWCQVTKAPRRSSWPRRVVRSTAVAGPGNRSR
jgi:tripartite-type tricarboxylate transporter receptor subunit TctC